MTNSKTVPSGPRDERAERLAAQLRENLKRRKMQARSRRAGGEDDRDDGLASTKSAGKP